MEDVSTASEEEEVPHVDFRRYRKDRIRELKMLLRKLGRIDRRIRLLLGTRLV